VFALIAPVFFHGVKEPDLVRLARPGRGKNWCLCLRRAEFAERPFEEGEVLVRVIGVQRVLDAAPDRQRAALERVPALVRAIAAAVRGA